MIFNSIDPLEIFTFFSLLALKLLKLSSNLSSILILSSSLFAHRMLKRSCEKEGGGGEKGKLETRAMRIVTYVSIYYGPVYYVLPPYVYES